MTDPDQSRRCCIILGMHRSGTSCLARMLHAAGLDMGRDLLVDRYWTNLGGHWESAGAIRINDRLLALSDGSWDRPPAHLHADDVIHRDIQEFLKTLEGSPRCGWKDPRMTLTLPVWLPHLKHLKLVACIRHPYQVAHSLCARGDGPFSRGLELWRAYNERLLEYHDQGLPIFWFPYDADRAAYRARFEDLCGHLGLKHDDRHLNLLNEFLRHQGDEPPIAEPEIGELYSRLLELAASPQVEQAPGLDRPAIGRGGLDHVIERVADLQRKIDSLGEAVTSGNAEQQRESLAVWEISGTMHEFGRTIDRNRAACEELRAELYAELHKTAHDLESSLRGMIQKIQQDLAREIQDLARQIQEVRQPVETLRLQKLARFCRAGRSFVRNVRDNLRTTLRRVA